MSKLWPGLKDDHLLARLARNSGQATLDILGFSVERLFNRLANTCQLTTNLCTWLHADMPGKGLQADRQ